MQAITVQIGEITTASARLTVSLAIVDGVGTVHVYARDRSRDRSGYLILGAGLWRELKALVELTDATIEQLKKSGQLRFVVEGFQLVGDEPAAR